MTLDLSEERGYVPISRMCRRTGSRKAFGRLVSEQSVTQERIANARMMIDQSRLLTLKAAHMMDTVGNKAPLKEIGMIKVAVPNMACQVIDWAIQSFGAAGVSAEYGLAYAYSNARLIRIADGPDEVHRNQIARLELGRYGDEPSKRGGNAHVAPPDMTEGTNWKPRFIA